MDLSLILWLSLASVLFDNVEMVSCLMCSCGRNYGDWISSVWVISLVIISRSIKGIICKKENKKINKLKGMNYSWICFLLIRGIFSFYVDLGHILICSLSPSLLEFLFLLSSFVLILFIELWNWLLFWVFVLSFFPIMKNQFVPAS